MTYLTPLLEQSPLTKREREILSCLAEGLSSKQIADKLYISKNTVDNHRKNMLRKIKAKSSTQLILAAV